MAVLTTTALLKAHNMMTGPLSAAAAQVRKINGSMGAGVAAMGAVGRTTAAAGLVGAFGIQQMYEQAKKFEEKVFGVGISTIPDTIKAGGDAAAEAAVAMQAARVAAMGLSKDLSMDPVRAAEIQEAVAKAGVLKDHVADVSKTIGLMQMTDKEAKTDALADYSASLSTVYAGYMKLKGINPAEFFKQAGDAIAVAAAETSLSTGSMLEGARQFAAVAAQYGASPEEIAARMAAAKKASGLNHIELGQTEKSNLLRFALPTAANVSAFNRLGLNRRDYFEDGSGTVAADEVTAKLAKMTNARLRGKERTAFTQSIAKMTAAPLADDEDGEKWNAWNETMIQRLGKVMGYDMKQDANRDKIVKMWESAIVGGGKIKQQKLYEDLASKVDKDPNAVQETFEKKRSALILGILNAYKMTKDDKTGETSNIYRDMLKTIQASRGKMLDSTLEAFNQSPYGRMMAMESALKRFSATIMQSSAATAVLTQLANGLKMLDEVNPQALNMGVKLGLIGLAAGPMILAAKGLGAIAMAGGGALAVIGRLAASPFLRLGAWFAGLGSALSAVGAAGLATAAGGLGAVLGVVGKLVRFGAIGLIGGGLVAMLLGPQEAMAAWNKFTDSNAVHGLVDAVKGLMTSLDGALTKTLEMFGIDAKGSAFFTSIEMLVGWIGKIVSGIDYIITKTAGLDAKGKPTDKPIFEPDQTPMMERMKAWWRGDKTLPARDKDDTLSHDQSGRIGRWLEQQTPTSLPARDKDTTPYDAAQKQMDAADKMMAAAEAMAAAARSVGATTPGRPAEAAKPVQANGGQYGRN